MAILAEGAHQLGWEVFDVDDTRTLLWNAGVLFDASWQQPALTLVRNPNLHPFRQFPDSAQSDSSVGS